MWGCTLMYRMDRTICPQALFVMNGFNKVLVTLQRQLHRLL